MPDTYVLIEVVGEDERIPDAVELALTFRGTTVAVVNGHTDIIGAHFEQAFTPQCEHGTIVARPEIALPGDFEIVDAQRVKRGEMKLSAPKPNTNKGRYTRTDTYQVHFNRS
ncbi:hypothetical protein [Mycobacterium camsae]|uniref:hypothetical protein n=1 Tax=Mycobacterium gordonae TaxID=1778 RepID=UPI0019821B28|nr:hypothetical protein [Mycobacterium gordonae]